MASLLGFHITINALGTYSILVSNVLCLGLTTVEGLVHEIVEL